MIEQSGKRELAYGIKLVFVGEKRIRIHFFVI